MKVRNIGSNMTEIEIGDKLILVSYETPVACAIMGDGYYRTSKKWSATTTRHINKWLASHQGLDESKEIPQSDLDSLLLDDEFEVSPHLLRSNND